MRTSSARFGWSTAAAVVVANMIGAGVFTSLGFQLLEISSGFVLLALWAVGGLIALAGALCYAELGAALPRSGGEYNFLSRIFHPSLGFIAGWQSATIGFAAPAALAAITFGAYLNAALPDLDGRLSATMLLLMLTLAHASSRRSSSRVQNWFTMLKIALILAFCLLVWLASEPQHGLTITPQAGDAGLLVGGAFAVALIYVNYAYTGWNAATYVSGEMRNPQRHLPLALALGTCLVTGLYLLLNFIFLYAAPMSELAGRIEIGVIVAEHAFGPTGGKIMGLGLALLLISTASAMTLAGPRVMQMIGEDFPALSWLAGVNRHGVPALAICAQSALALALVWTAAFESILLLAGFSLGLCTLVTVAGVFVLRWRQPNLARPYRAPAWPLPGLIYLALNSWVLIYICLNRPFEALASLGLIAVGGVLYPFCRRARRQSPRSLTQAALYSRPGEHADGQDTREL